MKNKDGALQTPKLAFEMVTRLMEKLSGETPKDQSYVPLDFQLHYFKSK